MSDSAASRMGAWRGLLVVAMATSFIAIGWRWYTQPYRDAKRVGIDAERLRRSGRCTSLPREIICLTAFGSPDIPDVQEQLSVDPRNRGLLLALRSWTMADSAKWVAALDSIRRAARKFGGQPAPCDASETGFAVAEAWTLGRHELRLYAAEKATGRLPRDRWFIAVQLIPAQTYGCGRVFTRRPTIAEMDSMFRVWMREHLPF